MKKTIKFCSLFFFLLSFIQVNAQKIDYKDEATKENSNFYEIVKETRKQFLEKEFQSKGVASKSLKKERKQFERWVYAWKDKVNVDGTFPKNILDKQEYLNLLLNNSNSSAKTSSTIKPWVQIGPTVNVEQNGYTQYPGLGRINVVAVDANNPLIMYAGAAAGGLWKTTDGGSTWTPKTDSFAGLGVTDIIIDPNNSSIIYMATGDEDAQHISSIGVFKSTDAGDTWAATGLTFSLSDNEYVRDLSFAPGSSTTIFALTNNEIKKSTDAGVSWVNKPAGTYVDDNFQNIIFDPNDATKVIVSDALGGIFYSSDSGENFTEHSVYFGETAKKLKLTTSPNDTDHFYGFMQDIRDDNGNITTQANFIKFRFAIDDSANDKISETTLTGVNTQGGYNQCLAVSPTNKNNIIVGGVNGWKSTDNGATFSMLLNAYDTPSGVGFYVHPDHHHLSFIDGTTIINGHDGGVHKGAFSATAASGGWTDLSNGLVISQPYNIAITQGINGDDYMMANQDNDGFSRVLKGGTQQWVACQAGDGTATGIDISDPAIRYLGGTNGSLNKTPDGYSSDYANAVEILPSITDGTAAFVSPLALHPTVAATIYAGHSDVKKSVDRGANWTALTSGLTETSFLDVSLNDNSTTTRIFAIGKVGANITLRRSIDDGANWTTITGPAGVTINGVYAVPNTDVVYATVSSYTAGNKVHKSTDNGANWTNISGDLPNIIMYKIIMDPNKTNETLYLGTELGMYFTDNSTTNWAKLGTALPNVRISDIEVSENNGNVYIGTFGRGMWVYNDQKYFDNVTDNNWSTTANWEGTSLPSATDDVLIKATENVTLNIDGANIKSLEIEDGALLTINNTRDLTVENDFTSSSANAVVQINSDTNDSGVLIVKGTNATGKVKYVRGGLLGGANNWSVITPPVIGQSVKTFVEDANNAIRINTTPNPNRYAVAKYNDANAALSKWEYYETNVGAGVNFDIGIGYSISRASAGAVSFTGTIQKNTLNVAAVHDKWVAIGNPYSAYYPANKRDIGGLDFITNNAAKLADAAQAIYIWDDAQQKYPPIADLPGSTQKVIAPGQGFFIKMKPSGTDEMVVFNNSNLGTKTSLSGDHTFSKDANSTPFLKLFVEKGTIKVSTDIIFSETANNGFDIGQDIINFGTSEFDVTTQLLDKSSTEEYTIQSISKGDYVNQIVPVSLKANAASEVIFTASAFNLPDDIKIYLEDKELSKFFELSDNKDYKLTLNKSVNGFGRFYAHFSRGTLNVVENDIDEIQILNQNNFIHIKGLDSGLLSIEVFDVNGKRVLNRNENFEKLNAIDLSSFSKGVYLVKVTKETRIASKKILIN